MYKKLITACMAIAAFAAFVVPSTASATNDPMLTDEGKAIEVGKLIVGTSVGETTFVRTNGEGLVHCTNAKMTGSVVKNTGGNVEGTITTSDFWGTGEDAVHNKLPECTGAVGDAWITVANNDLCIRSTTTMATDEFQVAGGTCPGTGNVKFIIGSTVIGECEYESTTAIKGTYTTNGTQASLTVKETQEGSGSKKIRGSILCPSSGMLKMTFTLETENSEPVVIS